MVIMQLEDYGFCGIGEGGPFVAEGNIRWPDGSLPVNTHGGNLSEAYIIGMTHVKEAVEQTAGHGGQPGRRRRGRARDRRARRRSPCRSLLLRQLRSADPMRGVPPADIIGLTPEPVDRAVLAGRGRAPARGAALHELRHVPVAAVAVLLRCRAQEVEWIEHDGAGDDLLLHGDAPRGDPEVADALPFVAAVVELPGHGRRAGSSATSSTATPPTCAWASPSPSTGTTYGRANRYRFSASRSRAERARFI